jgi:uncharacterized protein YkwD
VTFRLRVKPASRNAPRTVRLQHKRQFAKGWTTVRTVRTAGRGTVTLRWRAPATPGGYSLRVVVLKSPTAKRAVTSVVHVRVEQPPPPVNAPAEVMALVNKVRAEARWCGSEFFPAAQPLATNAILMAAAQRYAARMNTEGFYSHISPDGDGPGDRARALGYTGSVGENIASGYETASSVVNGWLSSPGHCANIMSPYASQGVGKSGLLWVHNFGTTP